MRSKVLFKCGISLNFLSIMLILFSLIMFDAPPFIFWLPLIIMMIIATFVAIMGGKKIIITENGLKLLEKTIFYKDIVSVIVDYPLMEIKINQPKNNRYRIDYNLDIIKVIENYFDENKIKYINKVDSFFIYHFINNRKNGRNW